MNNVLGLVEQLNENLTGGQIEAVLDSLILAPIKLIIKHTTLVERMFAEMLPLVVSNTRRRIGFHDNQQTIDLLFSFLMDRDINRRVKLFAEMRLERTVPFHIITLFESLVKDYDDKVLQFPSMTLEERQPYLSMEKRVGFESDGISFFHLVREVKATAQLAYMFRSMITEKYVRFSYQIAKKQMRKTNLDIDLDQLFKDILIGVMRGIDKYHSERGPLTGYVQFWMIEAANQGTETHENNTSYHVPTPRRAKHLAEGGYNFAIAMTDKAVEKLETDSIETNFVVAQENDYFARIAAIADKDKMSFLSHGLMYPLSEDEKLKLKLTRMKAAS